MPTDWNDLPLDELFARLCAGAGDHIDIALREDLGPEHAVLDHDVTGQLLVEADRRGVAGFRSRRNGRLAGLPLLPIIAAKLDPALHVQLRYSDGMAIKAGETFATISGPLRAILAAERTMLNYLGMLSGIATLTAQYVHHTEGTDAKIYDTRKTLPGMRNLSKYAVRCGGGFSHRIGLFDAVLIKDNHLAHVPARQLQQRLGDALAAARQRPGVAFVEVEVDTLEQFRAVATLDVDVILLDNMTAEEMREAVYLRNDLQSRAVLEASGGVNLDTVRQIAETGVHRIAVGAVTHSAPVLDIGLDIA
jgi:nicotinate-nucleotide pyrophosphorylase (carboxylating)